MKNALFTVSAILLTAMPALAQDQKSARICIPSLDIRSSGVADDEKTITFTMLNGDRWRNDLASRCTGLRFTDFSWVQQGEEICENQHTLRVPRSIGGVCTLGKFTQLPKRS